MDDVNGEEVMDQRHEQRPIQANGSRCRVFLSVLTLSALTVIGAWFQQEASESKLRLVGSFNSSNPLSTLRSYSAILQRAMEGAKELYEMTKDLDHDPDMRNIGDGALLLEDNLDKASKKFTDMANRFELLSESSMYKKFVEDGHVEEVKFALKGLVQSGENAMAIVASSKDLVKQIKKISEKNPAHGRRTIMDHLDVLPSISSSRVRLPEIVGDIAIGRIAHLAVGDIIQLLPLVFPIAVLTVFIYLLLLCCNRTLLAISLAVLFAMGGAVTQASAEVPTKKIQLVIGQKLEPIMAIVPDHLPMINGTWRKAQWMHESGKALQGYVEGIGKGLEAGVETATTLGVNFQKLQEGNWLTANHQYDNLLDKAKSISFRHREYQKKLERFFKGLQYLYLKMLTILKNSPSPLILIEKLREQMDRLEGLEQTQQSLSDDIKSIITELKDLRVDIYGLQESHEKWKLGSGLVGGAAGVFTTVLAVFVPPIGIPVAVVTWGGAAVKTWEHRSHEAALTEMRETVGRMRDFAVEEERIVRDKPEVDDLKGSLDELMGYAKEYPEDFSETLKDKRGHEYRYFAMAIATAEEGLAKIDKAINRLKKLTAD